MSRGMFISRAMSRGGAGAGARASGWARARARGRVCVRSRV